MSIVSNLYPPIIPDVIPAFIRSVTCKIHFSLSSFNQIKDIKNVQVTLINQKTNASAFKTNLYPSGIKITTIKQDQSVLDNYKYYIQIAPSDLVNGVFQLNQFYKVQLRFTSTEAADPPSTGTKLNTWLSDNKDYFSEWSIVCLIKGIEQPRISIQNFDLGGVTILQAPLTEIVGKMYYNNNVKEQEYLRSYNIKIYQDIISNNNLIFTSNQIYTNSYNPNEINCEIKYDLLNDINYILVLNYTTKNLYTDTISFNFKINFQRSFLLDAITSFEADEDNGRIKISVAFHNSIYTDKDLIIRRSSSRNNFTQWETIKTIPHAATPQSGFIWYDTSIESGVWYKYRIQQTGGIGKLVDSDQPIMCVFEDMFLTNGSKQLKIQFNPIVSNLRYNVMESQQVTLGSQFPYIKRNGNNFYRTFSIGGLITSLIDNADWYNPNYYDNNFHSAIVAEPFTSKFELYKNSKSLYDNYNENNNINIYQDYIYEREFRQQVENFLYKYDAKLFRSLTQGNILVKLMDINLQPMNELGRRLYSFSATAVEINEPTIDNYKKYNIVNNYFHEYGKGSFTASFEAFDSIFNKIYNRISSSTNKNLINILKIDVKPSTDRAIFQIQKLDDKEASSRSILTANKVLSLQGVNEYIKDCYFCGKHQAIVKTYADGYYEDFPKSPRTNTLYRMIINRTNAVHDYVDYNNQSRLLTVTEQGVLLEPTIDYSLLTKEDYNVYIYRGGKWYLVDVDANEVGVPVSATITYQYEIIKGG